MNIVEHREMRSKGTLIRMKLVGSRNIHVINVMSRIEQFPIPYPVPLLSY